MIRKMCEIVNKLGLHARAAAKLVHTASKYQSQVSLRLNDKSVNCKSIMGVMMLAASKHAWVELIISGEDETDALQAIESLIADRFGEER